MEPPLAENHNDTEMDNLFLKTADEIKEGPVHAQSDAPSNINTEDPSIKDDLKSLENEFSNTATEEPKEKISTTEEPLPEIRPEVKPELEVQNIAENADSNAGKIMNYKVQKGETLMQIAFKIYGDISKWKYLRQMNESKLSRNSALIANMELKYKVPEKIFVWNPEGNPYLIKNGETLGTISSSVYQTPKKWKKIWENNKPMIKNPNIIFAGFTIYYKGNGMANNSKKDQTISTIEKLDSSEEIDLSHEIWSSTRKND